MAQKPAPQPPPPPEQEPPEEDESEKPKEYTFNPLQAAKEIRAGNYYFKKGNFRAAVRRYTEATRWDPGGPQGYLQLGEAAEKLGDRKTAKQAYKKYLELAPDAKNASAIRKKVRGYS